MIRLDTTLSSEQIERRLQRKGIRLQALSDFYLSSEPENECAFIVSYSNIDVQCVSEAFDQIYESVISESDN